MICTEAQWDNIANFAGCPPETGTISGNGIVQNCEAGATYILGANIDFQNTNTTIGFDFTGELRGAYKTLSNLNNPLFSKITTNANEVRISDLTIINSQINYAGDALPMGVLARELENSGNGSYRVEIDNINVYNSSVNDTSGGGTNGNPVGGLIGSVDWFANAPSSGEDLFIREIYINADISSQNYGVQSIGGVIGKLRGNNTNNVALEMVTVGVKERPQSEWDTLGRYNYEDYSEAITIDASADPDISAGGIIGEIFGSASVGKVELRLGNVAFSNITGVNNIGGIVGMIDQYTSYTKINNNFAHLNFTPSANANYVGGIVGLSNNPSGATSIDIEGSAGHVNIASKASPESTYQVNYIGGIIGAYFYQSAAATLKIEDSRGVMQTYVAGNSHGGIGGDISCGTCSSPADVILRSVAMGEIWDEAEGGSIDDGNTNAADVSSSGLSDSRGGLVGYAKYIVMKDNVIDASIEGDFEIGGVVGKGDEVYIKNTDISLNLFGYTSNLGGIAGTMVMNADFTYVDNIAIDADIRVAQDVTDCSGSSCGSLYGALTEAASTFDHTGDILALVGISDSNDDDLSGLLCGADDALCTPGDGLEVTTYQTSDATCGSLGTDFSLADVDGVGGNVCELNFFIALAKFAPVLDGSGNLEYFRTGSIIDPYEIKTAADWNAIGENEYLMKKSFEVKNNINFGGSNPTPIGSDTSASATTSFAGVIFGDGTLSNFAITTSGNNHGGLINSSYGGELGLRQWPLKIENYSITCSSTTSCGLIGYAHGSKFFVNVKNAQMSGGTGGSVGGLAGIVDEDTEIDRTGFQGKINTPSAVNVGGFFGATDTANAYIRAEESYAKLDFIRGNTGSAKTGGFVGNATAADHNSYFKKSYVWLNPSNLNVGNTIEGSSRGGLAGGIGSANFTFESVYVDFSNAVLPGGTTEAITPDLTSGGQTITNVGVIGTGSGGTLGNTAPWQYDHQAPSGNYTNLITNITAFNDSDKWTSDSQGRLVLDWEINGFDK